MARAQCIVHRKNKLLMTKNRQDGVEWWCLPGGSIEEGETPAEAAIRELKEECCVDGTVIRATGFVMYSETAGAHSVEDRSHSFLVDIGDQTPRLGADPEFSEVNQALVGVQWLALSEIPERDRAFLWAAGLLGVDEFLDEVAGWGDSISYPTAP